MFELCEEARAHGGNTHFQLTGSRIIPSKKIETPTDTDRKTTEVTQTVSSGDQTQVLLASDACLILSTRCHINSRCISIQCAKLNRSVWVHVFFTGGARLEWMKRFYLTLIHSSECTTSCLDPDISQVSGEQRDWNIWPPVTFIIQIIVWNLYTQFQIVYLYSMCTKPNRLVLSLFLLGEPPQLFSNRWNRLNEFVLNRITMLIFFLHVLISTVFLNPFY